MFFPFTKVRRTDTNAAKDLSLRKFLLKRGVLS